MNIWLKLLHFVQTVVFGGKAKIDFAVGVTLPKFSISDTFDIFGSPRTITLFASGDDDKIGIEVS